MSERRHDRGATKRLAVSSVLCAMAVVAMGLGAVIEVLDLTAAAMASVALLPILLTYGDRYAILAYATTAVLGVILMPQTLSSWLYLGLLGYYPILKRRIDRLPRLLAYLCKLALVCAALAVCFLLMYFIMFGGHSTPQEAFLAAFGEADGSPLLAWAFVGLSIFTFGIFDLLIDRILILYRLKWKGRIDKWMK